METVERGPVKRGPVKRALYEAELEIEIGEALYEDYSGRGMYGAECFGLVLSSGREYGQFLVALCEQEESELAGELARAVRQDSMGHSNIYYFPGYQLEKETDTCQISMAAHARARAAEGRG